MNSGKYREVARCLRVELHERKAKGGWMGLLWRGQYNGSRFHASAGRVAACKNAARQDSLAG
jgi:hypothetical protein